MAQNVMVLSGAGFEEQVAASELPVLIEVGASWCPPCRVMEPVLEELAAEQAGRLEVFKVDADTNPGIISRFDVAGLPTFLVFHAGELVGRTVGARGKGRLLEDLAGLIS